MEESSPVGYKVSMSTIFGKHHTKFLGFGETLSPVTQKPVFIFSPCGDGKIQPHSALKEKLVNRVALRREKRVSDT